MQFYFAWVPPSTAFNAAAHAVEDEDVFAFDISETEGELPSLTLDIRNPREGLLNEGRDFWAWLSVEEGSDITPLFYGRLVGVPEQLQDELVRLIFVARPVDYDAQKEALAASLRVAPYHAPEWISPDRLDDPDAVLEARPALWHVDRVTHTLTASSIIAGEGTLYELGEDAIFYESLDLTFRGRPASKVKCEAEVFWDQAATGTVDITPRMLSAFNAAGSANGFVTSYTGEGLSRTWPEQGDRIGAGWSVGATTLRRVDGAGSRQRIKTFELTDGGTGAFPLWSFRATFPVDYQIERGRSEVMRFAFNADVQRIYTDESEDETITVTLASAIVGEPIDPGGQSPIRDSRWKSFFLTDRGKQSLEYLITLCHTRLLFRARAVDVSVDVPFDAIMGITCRDSARITDARLPGGKAVGKVAGYSLGLDGDRGELRASVTIACTIGNDNALTITSGTPTYVEAGYVEDGYQALTGGTVGVLDNAIAYSNFDGTTIDDDGVDLANLTPANSVLNATVINGEAAQTALLNDGPYEDISAAITALNDTFTEVALTLQPLNGGPFRTEFDITVSDLMIPRTIDLTASEASE